MQYYTQCARMIYLNILLLDKQIHQIPLYYLKHNGAAETFIGYSFLEKFSVKEKSIKECNLYMVTMNIMNYKLTKMLIQ